MNPSAAVTEPAAAAAAAAAAEAAAAALDFVLSGAALWPVVTSGEGPDTMLWLGAPPSAWTAAVRTVPTEPVALCKLSSADMVQQVQATPEKRSVKTNNYNWRLKYYLVYSQH